MSLMALQGPGLGALDQPTINTATTVIGIGNTGYAIYRLATGKKVLPTVAIWGAIALANIFFYKKASGA